MVHASSFAHSSARTAGGSAWRLKRHQPRNQQASNHIRPSSRSPGARKVSSYAESSDNGNTIVSAETSSVVKKAQVRIRSARGGHMAVGMYPMFAYNALGGGGIAVAEPAPSGGMNVRFDPKDVYIPDLYFRTTTFLGMPLLWPFRIAILPERLEGVVNFKSGDVELEFDTSVAFTAGALYKAPQLQVKTVLTTGTVRGRLRSGSGQRLVNGKGRLVGVATIEPTGDKLLDSFLMLPTDCYTELPADFEVV